MSGFETVRKPQGGLEPHSPASSTRWAFPGSRDPRTAAYTWDYLMKGEMEKAIDHYLEYELTEPLARNLDRHRKRLYAAVRAGLR